MADQSRTLRHRLAVPLAAVALIAASDPARGQDAAFRAGAATSNVTPPLGHSINGNMSDGTAQQIHDELHARCLVLDDGKTRLAFAVVDSCAVPREIVEEAKGLIQSRSGIAPDHVLISATHTHSAPTATGVFQSEPTEEYSKFLARRIADGVQRAADNLAPAEIGWGAGAVPGQVFNRRWFVREGAIPPNPFGETDEKVRMNPPVGSPDLVRPAGPTDPTVSVLMARSPEGRPIALLANYSLHYVGGVGPGHVSADYYGSFADRVQQLLDAERLDPPFVALMSNGTSGDINNINFREPRPPRPPYEQIRAVADDVAREAVRVAREMEFRRTLTLDAAANDLTLGVRKPDETELTRAREILDAARGRELTTLEQLYARESVLIHDYPDTVTVTVQALRVGEVGIVAIPCEVFVEIGLGIRKESPLRPTFTIELANGYNGYLPDPRGHELGGYETWRARSSYLEVEASNKIRDAASSLLRKVERSRAH
jgi:neutral ceramidase